jgi:membrane-associated protein
MEALIYLFKFILHIDVYLGQLISSYGIFVYGILFTIIFIETGLVIMPFLPGDSLLFAAGAFSALGSLNIFSVLILLCLAAFLGDTANYWIGHFFGEKIIANKRIPINQNHIDETQKFFDKHGGKTIVLARFVPIVRTFAPFVAGIGKMSYPKFISYNIVGGVTWVMLFTLAGFFFGNIPTVKHNFTLVIMAIILLSILPMVYTAIKAKVSSKK